MINCKCINAVSASTYYTSIGQIKLPNEYGSQCKGWTIRNYSDFKLTYYDLFKFIQRNDIKFRKIDSF